jgi:23S rRNA G2069 N7-methylase RlmK/C1962 C5-methylase RlmI
MAYLGVFFQYTGMACFYFQDLKGYGMNRDCAGVSGAGGDCEAPFLSDQKIAAQAEMFANRLKKRFRHLKKWAKRRGVDAFRLYDRDIPEIPLILDWYGDAIAGALYQGSRERDEAEKERWLAAMRQAAADALGIPADQIFLKERRRLRGRDEGNVQYGKFGGENFVRIAEEGGLKFRVNLSDYLDTGLFLDRRIMRGLVREEAAGKRVLNLFCYTASFSVYAASGGAAETDSVDISNTYLEWARENFALNGFAAQVFPRGPRRTGKSFSGSGAGRAGASPAVKGAAPNRLIRADVLRFLSGAASAGKTWDLIILDPPAFSNSKKMSGVLDVRRDHRELLSRCLVLLAPGGRLWFSAGIRGFRPDPAALQAALSPRFPDLNVSDAGREIVDEDFKGGRLPACYIFRRGAG